MNDPARANSAFRTTNAPPDIRSGKISIARVDTGCMRPHCFRRADPDLTIRGGYVCLPLGISDPAPLPGRKRVLWHRQEKPNRKGLVGDTRRVSIRDLESLAATARSGARRDSGPPRRNQGSPAAGKTC